MRGLFATRRRENDGLFDRIGAFLAEQGLNPDPDHYRFAYHVITDPDGPIATAVGTIVEGGIRLSRSDIDALGGTTTGAGDVARRARSTEDDAIRLVAETQAQVDGFATMMQAMREETRGFGEDLAQSAAAMRQDRSGGGLDGIARLTGAMLARVRDSETRLVQAVTEADALREKLAEANASARSDALTGLPNRRAFEEAFVARHAACGPYCLAVCDIDRFKRINDDHGHAVGDRVLSAVGRTLADECAGHLVVRHGGEEFAVLLAGTDLAGAADHLDTVRAIIAAKRLRVRESDLPIGEITLSIGVTAVQAGDDSGTAFDRADRLLYRAKAEGRDRVCAA